jgi:CBS-domain-containing membrane protein
VPAFSSLVWTFIAAFVGIFLVSYFALEFEFFPLFAPFGASAVLLYGAPSAPFSQPRSLLGGHIISALVGVIVSNIFGTGYVAVAFGVALAIVCMLLARAVHPPAGATALLGVTASQGSFAWVLAPVTVGALILLVVALVVNNLDPSKTYPDYWF